jgi:hypothetical protein
MGVLPDFLKKQTELLLDARFARAGTAISLQVHF